MRNMAVLHSPAFSYPLPVLVRVLSNLLIFKGKILYYNKDNENMQYKRLYFLLFVDGFGGFGKNQQRYGSHQTYSRKVIPDVMRIGAGSFPSFPGCK